MLSSTIPSRMIRLTVIEWLLGSLCAVGVGVSKTGVPGLAIVVVPLMVLAVGDARQSAGWLLPLLCLADVFALHYWRRHTAARRLLSLAPWVFAGIAAGALALALPERTLRYVVGAIVIVMLSLYLARRLRPDWLALPTHSAPYGMATGFATTVANAASPVMNLYLLSKRLPKEEFLATGAWFFFFVNLSKVPIYLWHGLIGPRSLMFDALVSPAVLAGAVAGRWLVDKIPQRLFDWLVVALTVLSTLLLFR